MNESETGGRDRLFFLRYKDLTIVGGGRPAVILAVGAPLTIVPAIAMVLNVLGQWFLFGIIIVDLALFSTLAGIWIRMEKQSTLGLPSHSLDLTEARSTDRSLGRRGTRMDSNGQG